MLIQWNTRPPTAACSTPKMAACAPSSSYPLHLSHPTTPPKPSRIYTTALYSHSSPPPTAFSTSPPPPPSSTPLLSSYCLINPHTEAYTTPYSPDHPGEPVHIRRGQRLPAVVSSPQRLGAYARVEDRSHAAEPGDDDDKGLVTALALGSGGVLPAGTKTKHVGLWVRWWGYFIPTEAALG